MNHLKHRVISAVCSITLLSGTFSLPVFAADANSSESTEAISQTSETAAPTDTTTAQSSDSASTDTTSGTPPTDPNAPPESYNWEVQSDSWASWPKGPQVAAETAILMDVDSGEILYAKGIDEKRYPASTTKIMTCIIALEHMTDNEIVTASAYAASQPKVHLGVREGQQFYLRDILFSLMLESHNDSAVMVAEEIAGSVETFVKMMNEKAEELGLGNTHFMNPSGLDNPEHYTTVYNLALIARYAMTLPRFREIVATQTAQVQALNSDEILYFSNHNKMLSLYEGANGIKTGFTKSTGRCLVSSAQRDGMEFIAVTLNDPNDWNDHTEMLDYAFSEHYPKKLIEQGDTVKVTNIDGKDYSMVAASDFTIPFKEHQKTQVEVISHISNDLQAPINQGEKVGWLEIVCDGVSIGEVDIISENDIYGVSNIRLKNSFFSSFIRVAKILLV